MKRRTKKKLLLSIIILVIIFLVGFAIYKVKKSMDMKVILIDSLKVEINDEINNNDFIKNIKNGTNQTKNKKIDTYKLGKQKIELNIKNKFNQNKKYTFNIEVVDTIVPSIIYEETLSTNKGKAINLLNDIKVSDNSKEIITPKVEGEYDFNKVGSYKLKYVAKDSSGNEKKEEFTLTVKSNKNPYYIKINRQLNTVMVYGLDNEENYTVLIKTFICSTGRDTPLGTYNTTDKYTWRALVGGVYGQYATRITGSILFHTVPYFSQDKSDLEYEEYNKLGTKASLGCIRMTVADAKWIYDNCPKGTTVNLYDSDTLPDGVKKPSFKKIDTSSSNKGWDPTDPDKNNPWKK